jgi:hypothetical protein
LILVTPADSVAAVLSAAAALGDRGWQIGEMASSTGQEPAVEYVD